MRLALRHRRGGGAAPPPPLLQRGGLEGERLGLILGAQAALLGGARGGFEVSGEAVLGAREKAIETATRGLPSMP